MTKETDNISSRKIEIILGEDLLKELETLRLITDRNSIGEVISDSISFYRTALHARVKGFTVGVGKNGKLEKSFDLIDD